MKKLKLICIALVLFFASFSYAKAQLSMSTLLTENVRLQPDSFRVSGLVDGALCVVGDTLFIGGLHAINYIDLSAPNPTLKVFMNNGIGNTDGGPTVAKFAYIRDMVTDGKNLYIVQSPRTTPAPFNNATVRKVNIATKTVGTIAGGSVSPNIVDGKGTAAGFGEIMGIAITSTHDRLYVTDFDHHAIKQITLADSMVSTIVSGNGVANGDFANAQCQTPRNIIEVKPNVFHVTYTNTGARIKEINLLTNQASDILFSIAAIPGITQGRDMAYIPSVDTVLIIEDYYMLNAYDPNKKHSQSKWLSNLQGNTDGDFSVAQLQGARDIVYHEALNRFYILDIGNKSIRFFNYHQPPVNTAPGFTLQLDTVEVFNNVGNYSIANFATNINPNDGNQSLVGFTLKVANPSLFLVQPAIDVNTGELTFTPDSATSGLTTVTICLKDDGGTVNGGVDTTCLDIVISTMPQPNKAPSFDLSLLAITVPNDTGAVTFAGFATNMSANDNNQTLSFVVSTNADSLFDGSLMVSATNGDLTFTPNTANAGTATVTLCLNDNGGTANGGVDSLCKSFSITTTTPISGLKTYAVINHSAVVYPNPVKKGVDLQLQEAVKQGAVYEIFSASGKLVRHGRLTQNAISTSGLDDGVYILKIRKDTKRLDISKFIVF